MFKLPDSVNEKFKAAQRDEQSRRAMFANLNDADLVASAKFWMAHCHAPKKVQPGEPIYDATFWHDIVPELLRRIGDKS